MYPMPTPTPRILPPHFLKPFSVRALGDTAKRAIIVPPKNPYALVSPKDTKHLISAVPVTSNAGQWFTVGRKEICVHMYSYKRCDQRVYRSREWLIHSWLGIYQQLVYTEMMLLEIRVEADMGRRMHRSAGGIKMLEKYSYRLSGFFSLMTHLCVALYELESKGIVPMMEDIDPPPMTARYGRYAYGNTNWDLLEWKTLFETAYYPSGRAFEAVELANAFLIHREGVCWMNSLHFFDDLQLVPLRYKQIRPVDMLPFVTPYTIFAGQHLPVPAKGKAKENDNAAAAKPGLEPSDKDDNDEKQGKAVTRWDRRPAKLQLRVPMSIRRRVAATSGYSQLYNDDDPL